MFFQHRNLIEIVLEIPNFDLSLIRRCNYVGLNWMHNDCPDEIVVGLELFNFIHGVVIEHSNMEIVGA